MQNLVKINMSDYFLLNFVKSLLSEDICKYNFETEYEKVCINMDIKDIKAVQENIYSWLSRRVGT
jgi:hypothetical protein